MAIEAIALEGPEVQVSAHVARLIATCSRGWERFFAEYDDHQAPRFVPSVPERVWAVLAEVTRRQLPPTRVFCEESMEMLGVRPRSGSPQPSCPGPDTNV